MPTVRSVQGLAVYDAKDRPVGTVTHVLFHPSDACVVGVEIQPPNLAYVVSRGPRYVALQGLAFSADRLELTKSGEWSGSRAEKALGFKWDKTVIWAGMPVASASGESLGYVRDASFSVPEGRLIEVLLTEGITSDTAIGTRRLDGSLLEGFDGSAVRASEEASQVDFSGGLAASAGKSAAVVTVAAGEAGKKAAQLGGQAVRAAAKSKTARGAWSVLRQTGKAFREGLHDEPDDRAAGGKGDPNG